MRALIQRVSRAKVEVSGRIIAEIKHGLLILVCAMTADTELEAEKLAGRIAKLRIFKDAGGKMNLALPEVGGACLVVSQFTLAADTARGNRPGFSCAAPPEDSHRLYLHFCNILRGLGLHVETGQFGADMAVSLTNDGPVTIWMDSADRA